jgi:hypothetical protein
MRKSFVFTFVYLYIGEEVVEEMMEERVGVEICSSSCGKILLIKLE